jgi:mercuric ion transport protein
MATDNSQTTPSERAPLRDTGALMLAAGGLAAAFGAASCCALPLLLGSLGLSSTWLVAVAWLAAPHRIALLIAAVVCLLGAGGMFVWRRRAVACVPGPPVRSSGHHRSPDGRLIARCCSGGPWVHVCVRRS